MLFVLLGVEREGEVVVEVEETLGEAVLVIEILLFVGVWSFSFSSASR